MSRIGKKPIAIPDGVEVKLDGFAVLVKGPKGELSRMVAPELQVVIEDRQVLVNPIKETKRSLMLWGTYASHITNMIIGVTEGFEKKLVVEGVGFKSEVSGKELVLNVGFSHPVHITIPEALTVTAEKNLITISGIDKEAVGLFASQVRARKKPEPYKGKGIRYEGEVIRRKQGKRAVGV